MSARTIGTSGPDTEIVEREPCDVCGASYREEVTFLDYQFDTWEKAEFVDAHQYVYAVTRRLYEKLEQAGLKGFSARAMKTSRGQIFEEVDPEHRVVIPEFVQLLILGKANGPSGWWDRGEVCPACGRTIWKPTSRVTEALFAKFSNKVAAPRLVSADTWEGDDIFFLTDPGPPVITDRFERVLAEQNVQGVELQPAEWVS